MVRISVATAALLCASCSNGVEDDVRNRLVDPNSAQFSELSTENEITCGLVNSKNRMGGYTGNVLFVTQGGDVAFWGDHDFESLGGTSACSAKALSIFFGNEARRLRAENDSF